MTFTCPPSNCLDEAQRPRDNHRHLTLTGAVNRPI
jgi:hypothetical protein